MLHAGPPYLTCHSFHFNTAAVDTAFASSGDAPQQVHRQRRGCANGQRSALSLQFRTRTRGHAGVVRQGNDQSPARGRVLRRAAYLVGSAWHGALGPGAPSVPSHDMPATAETAVMQLTGQNNAPISTPAARETATRRNSLTYRHTLDRCGVRPLTKCVLSPRVPRRAAAHPVVPTNYTVVARPAAPHQNPPAADRHPRLRRLNSARSRGPNH
jgi:hypothetical protein